MIKTKLILFIALQISLLAESPFESPKPNFFDTTVYETKKNQENIKASKNSQITCRYVCDKKIYKEQRISDAVEFYKTSRDYSSISDN